MPQKESNPTPAWSMALGGAAAAVTFSPQLSYISGEMPQIASAPRYEAGKPTLHQIAFDERLMDAKLEAVEARTETKFSQLLGKLDAISERIGALTVNLAAVDKKIDGVEATAKNAKSTITWAVVASAIGIAALAYAAVAIFQSGMGTTASAYQSGMAASEAQKNGNLETSPR